MKNEGSSDWKFELDALKSELDSTQCRTLDRVIEAHQTLLNKKYRITVEDLCAFVTAISGAVLRDKLGLDVRVGNYIAPRGGPEIRRRLKFLLRNIEWGSGLRNPPGLRGFASLHRWQRPIGAGAVALADQREPPAVLADLLLSHPQPTQELK